MKRIMKARYILCLLLLAASMISCEKWLDVKPKTQIAANDLYSSESGFKEALAGAYTVLADRGLYGRELTFGFMGVLGKEWGGAQVTTVSGKYYYANQYSYDDASNIVRIDSIFIGLYNSVAATNSILANIDAKKSIFSGDNYNIIKGECYGLRAFAHFDALRMFAPVEIDSETKRLPYVTTNKAEVTPAITNSEFVKKIAEDLNTAKTLLANDPVKTPSNTGVDPYLSNRNLHMNYYACEALLARLYLYAGDKEKALVCAQNVINAQKSNGVFPWVKSADVTSANTNKRDRTFSTEHIFALHTMELKKYILNFFKDSQNPLISRLSVTTYSPTVRFTEAGDYRKVFFESDNGQPDVPSKFWQPDMADVSIKNRMPMIKISEMYYIAAECLKETDLAGAVEMLRTVYKQRNLTETGTPNPATAAALQTALQFEYVREFIGEGQLFFYHKRMKTATIATAKANYVFPIPNLELIFGKYE